MLTLKDLLSNEKFSYLTFINPEVSTNRRLERVETTEASDVYNYIPKHTFLITTAMIYKDNQEPLCKLIEVLANFPITSLAIKISRFLGSLDSKVVEVASRCNFPILIIPENKTTGEVYSDVTNFLVDRKNNELLFAFQVHQKFYDLAMDNASIRDLIQSLSSLINKPIFLVDPFGNIMDKSLSMNVYGFKSPIRNLIEGISSESLYRDNIKNNYRETYQVKDMDFNVVPIKISKYYPYFLFVLNKDRLALKATEKLAIDQGVLVIGFMLFKELRIEFTNLSSENGRFQKILDIQPEDLGNQKSIKDLNLNPREGSSYQVILISPSHKDAPIKNYSFSVEWFVLIYTWFKQKLRNYRNISIYPDQENLRICLVLENQSINVKDLISYNNITHKTLSLDLTYGIGGVFNSILNLKDSYDQARKALDSGIIKNDIEFIKYYKTLNIGDLVKSIDINQVNDFIFDTLKDLAYPKDKYHRELRKTLKSYLESNCDASLTSKRLFIHRNTVLYRIEKCEKILDCKISTDTLNLDLLLALRMDEEMD